MARSSTSSSSLPWLRPRRSPDEVRGRPHRLEATAEVEPRAALLEDGRHDRHGRARGPRQEDAGVAGAEVGPALHHLVDRAAQGAAAIGEGAADLHVEAGLAVVALPQRGVVAGELELVVPLELQHHALERPRGCGGEQEA
jgi:hypothetical protein